LVDLYYEEFTIHTVQSQPLSTEQMNLILQLDKPDKKGVKYLSPTPRGGGKERASMAINDPIQRLKTIEGHLRGVIRMVEEDAYCIDVIRQIQAVEAALNKVSGLILEGHLNSCVITAVKGEDQSERQRVLKEILEVFETATKV
jgi:DNA-binding FrmR family transcriptional regulator